MSTQSPIPDDDARTTISALPTCELLGMSLAQIGQEALLDHMFAALARGRGGWLVTANLDFLYRYVRDVEARALYDAADIRVADGMPLVWAARLQGDPVPERVTGATLVSVIAGRAAAEKRSLYLLGGSPGAGERAAVVLSERFPGLEIKGTSSPWLSDPATAAELEPVARELARLRPDIIFVGLGSPKQEKLIQAVRGQLPAAWMIGVGVSFSFVAGDIRRAPRWMQRTGLEWLSRMVQEPRRLGRRYLIENLPFSVTLFAHALRRRVARRKADGSGP
jgi:N-acetylglucosaminyldiphosphoundecaprenol N-acetyl-beta-D-mannosaminyltransferase